MDPILLQKQVRDNSDDLRNYLKDLSSWEDEMKRKESTLKDKRAVHEVPTVRAKIKKTDKKEPKKEDKDASSQVKENNTQKIKAYDYRGWDKFDVEAECEKIDNEKKVQIESDTESSDDNFDPSAEYQARLRDEATYEKERGNQFVKQQKWSEAISCYTHAISCYPKDPIFFANRALCYLKKNDLASAEADCTSALQFDPNYVKALQRRAAARIGLKQYKDAQNDLKKVLELEPNNKESKKEFEKAEKMLNQHKKETRSESTIKYIPPPEKKLVEKKSEPAPKPSSSKEEPKVQKKPDSSKAPEIKIPWPSRPNAKTIKTVQKLPHLRSKTPLYTISVKEADGMERKLPDIDKPSGSGLQKNLSEKNNTDKKVLVADLTNLHEKSNEIKITNTLVDPKNFNYPIPKSSVQFRNNWKLIGQNKEHKYLYLKQINAQEIPNIFQEALESDIFGDIINTLAEKFVENNIDSFTYLKYLSNVKRFSTLIMFMSSSDKTALKKIFEFLGTKNIPREDLDVLKKKYEI